MVVTNNRKTRINLTTAYIFKDNVKSSYNRLKKKPTGLARISSPRTIVSHVRYQSP